MFLFSRRLLKLFAFSLAVFAPIVGFAEANRQVGDTQYYYESANQERIPVLVPRVETFSSPLCLMVKNLPLTVEGFGQFSASVTSEHKQLDVGFASFWLMADISPVDFLKVSLTTDIATGSVLEARTRLHFPGSIVGMQFGRLKSPVQQMIPRPDKDLVVGGPRAMALATKFPLGAEVFAKLGSVTVFLGAFSDEPPGGLTEKKLTDATAHVIWKLGRRVTFESTLQAGKHDDAWRLRAISRLGYDDGHLKTEMFGIYQSNGQMRDRMWAGSIAAAYHLAEMWEVSAALDELSMLAGKEEREARTQVTFLPAGKFLRTGMVYGYNTVRGNQALLHLQTNF